MSSASPPVRLKSPELAARKFLENTGKAKPFYLFGVYNPKRNPIEAALSAADTWHEKVSSDAAKTKFTERLGAVKQEFWQAMAELKGADRYPRGCEYGAAMMYDFLTKFLPHLANILPEVYAIKKVTIDDSVKRVETLIKRAHEFTYKPTAMDKASLTGTLSKIKAIKLPT
ncbi:MAG: hypothetical protein DRJ18_00710 [Candidatus Methanomethylicota archaeon]|nr:MAG: hypothetical protein DRJ18_00710 [Candidatus Verstraetearchaeota archaeon]